MKKSASSLRTDTQSIVAAALRATQPGPAVRKALEQWDFPPAGRLILIAIGKAAWQMAKAASDTLGSRISQGMVITKHGHSNGDIPGLTIREAGHPVPDAATFAATGEALAMVSGLRDTDKVLLLISGGGSSLFERPLLAPEEYQSITAQLLGSGADIREMNIIRKRLSAVKGGRFALACQPAGVYSVILSDIIGDPLDMIASGPASPDTSTCADALRVAGKYQLRLSDKAVQLLHLETPKSLQHVFTQVSGSVTELCRAAKTEAESLGYQAQILTASLACEAREAGRFLSAIAQYHQHSAHSLAFILGGETVVRLTGGGKGGRNQELALAAAAGIEGLKDTAIFSLGSDGTDGPTDAAGGYVDGTSAQALREAGINLDAQLNNNDSYPALKLIDGLLMTGPTGTNVNDLTVLLIRR